MIQEWNAFYRALRIVFWAMFMAPIWLFGTMWFLDNGNLELFHSLGLQGYFPYIIGAIILAGVLISLSIRKKTLGLLSETMDAEGQQELIRRAQILGCACVETAVFTAILGSHILGQREVMVYSVFATLLMLLHYPSKSRPQQLVGGNDA